MGQTLSMTQTLETILGIKPQEQDDFLQTHSRPEIDGLIEQANIKRSDASMRKKYAEMLGVPVERIKDLSREELDAKASVNYQNNGDLLIGAGFGGCGAVAYGLGSFFNQFTDEYDDMGLQFGIVGCAVWGIIASATSISQYLNALKHYKMLSPEKKKEIGRPWPGKMYVRAANFTFNMGMEGIRQGTNLGVEQAHKGMDYVRSGELKNDVNRGMDYVRSGELSDDIKDKARRSRDYVRSGQLKKYLVKVKKGIKECIKESFK